MPRVLALGLVILLVILSLPLFVSMDAMEPCPACPGTAMIGAWAMCLAVISLVAIFPPATATVTRPRSIVPRPLLLVSAIERPPRTV